MAISTFRFLAIALATTLTLLIVALTTALCFNAMMLTKGPSANDSTQEIGLNELEAAVACEAICPSSSMNCSEWNHCRFHYPEFCRGLIVVCRDRDGTGNEAGGVGPAKAVLDNPALQQHLAVVNAEQRTEEVPRMIFYIFTLFMVLTLLICIIRSKRVRRAQSVRIGKLAGKGQGDQAVLVLTIGKTVLLPSVNPEDLAQIKKVALKKLEAEGGFAGVENV